MRKIRVTKQERHAMQDAMKYQPPTKRVIIPGPWTNLPATTVQAVLKPSTTLLGQSILGVYTKDGLSEKGWYPIKVNTTSPNIAKDIATLTLPVFLAAAEKDLNATKLYGSIVLLSLLVDHSSDPAAFISLAAKTNKKSISEFAAIRKRKFVIL